MTTSNPAWTRRLWAFSDAHMGTDKRHGRLSLAEALVQSESGAFDWDIAVDLGDHSGAQGLPEEDEGREIVRQFGVLKQHRREDIFSVCGNHDRSGLGEVQKQWQPPPGAHVFDEPSAPSEVTKP